MSATRTRWSPRARRVRYLAATLVACCVLAACADKKKSPDAPPSLRERTDAAFEGSHDPYAPTSPDMPTVSGAEGKKFDKKGMRRDWDRFWNP